MHPAKPSQQDQHFEQLAADIAADIRHWSNQCLESPSPSHNNLAPCPFARHAWQAQQVIIHVTQSLDLIVDLKAVHPPTPTLTHIIAWLDYDDLSPEDFHAFLADQNTSHFGTWAAGFHPADPLDPSIPSFDPPADVDDYALIILQHLPTLTKASEQLRPHGYYQSYSAADLAYILNRNRQGHAWKETISEPLYNAQDDAAIARLIAQNQIQDED